MIKYLTKLIKFLFPLAIEEGQPVPLEIEIERVEKALRRHREELSSFNDSFDPSKDCCVDCMTGGYSLKLSEKIVRVEHWLLVLKQRKINRYSK